MGVTGTPQEPPLQGPAIRDARLERVTGEEHTHKVFELKNWRHEEERDAKGNLVRVTNTVTFANGSTSTTVYDFTTTPATVAQSTK
jgi:hypothetical protein